MNSCPTALNPLRHGALLLYAVLSRHQNANMTLSFTQGFIRVALRWKGVVHLALNVAAEYH